MGCEPVCRDRQDACPPSADSKIIGTPAVFVFLVVETITVGLSVNGWVEVPPALLQLLMTRRITIRVSQCFL